MQFGYGDVVLIGIQAADQKVSACGSYNHHGPQDRTREPLRVTRVGIPKPAN